MSEKIKNSFEQIPFPDTFPAALDIIKINGRWAQITTSRGEGAIVWLDSKQGEHHINLRNYRLIRRFDLNVENLAARFPDEKFTEEEINNIYYSGDLNTPEWKNQVKVFGEYESKSE